MGDPFTPTKQKRSDAAKSALLSALVIPGAGQLYNRQWVKGIFIAVIFTVASLSLLIPLTYDAILYYTGISNPNSPSFNPAFQDANPFTHLNERQYSIITLLVVSVVLYVYGIYDAYQTRKKKQ